MAAFQQNFKHKLIKNAVYSIDSFEVFPLVLNEIVHDKNNISFCNASECFAFKDAICRVKREPKNIESETESRNLVKLRKLRSVFHSGIEVLERFVKDNILPKERGANIAMRNLLNFLDKYSKPEAAKSLYRVLCEARGTTSCDETIILAHHILSQLVVCPAYTLDEKRTRGEKCAGCPCCGEQLSGLFGDTSIGNPKVWHGRLSIILESVSIECWSMHRDNDTEKEEEDTSNEDNEDTCFPLSVLQYKQHKKARVNTKTKEQFRAQNIVFSYLQRRLHPEFPHFLIPHIGISEFKIQLYFYDSEHDILIESRQENLFVNDEEINMKTIVGLWLALNHMYFCSGITMEMKDGGFTAGFLKDNAAKREIYENELKYGCESSTLVCDVNLDYKDDHDFVESETPLKKRKTELF